MSSPEHSSRAHSKLAPSNAATWVNCTKSVEFTEENRHRLPEESTKFSGEGTLAHEVAESLLVLNKVPAHKKYTPEMVEHGRKYADLVRSLMANSANLEVESNVPLWYMPDNSTGHVDAVVIQYGADTRVEAIHVIDYKYGQWVHVHAQDNFQIAIYAIGFIIGRFGENPNIDDSTVVSMHIFQPRSRKKGRESDVETWTTTWGKLKLLAASRIDISAEIILNPKNAHLRKFNPSEKTCMGCKAKSFCTARSEQLASWYFDEEEGTQRHPVGAMSYEQIGAILQKAGGFVKYINELEEYAYQQALKGIRIPGMKLVVGRGSREWLDEGLVLACLGDVADASNWKTTPKLLSPNQVSEKAKELGVSVKHLKPLITHHTGKLTLVSEDDEREESDPLSEFENLDNVENIL